jgi:type IV secretion system protein TrbL
MMRTFIELCAMFGILLLGPALVTQVIQSLMQYGATVSGVPNIQLSSLMSDGMDLIKILLAAGVKAGIHLSFLPCAVLIVSTLMVGWGFLRLGKSYLMALVESYAVVSVGAIMLGFGALKHTRTYPERYVSAAIGSGVKLMVCYFLVGVERLLIPIFSAQAQAINFSVFSTQDITGTLELVFGIALFLGVADVDKLMALIAHGNVSFSGQDVTRQYAPFANALVGGAVATNTMISRSFASSMSSIRSSQRAAAAAGGGRAGGIAPGAASRPSPPAPAQNGNGTGRRVAAPAVNGKGKS